MTQIVRTAIILAAGRGTRLGARGKLHPKGFIQLGERTIIEESIAKLQAAGVSRILLVTGHLSQHYESLAQNYAGLLTLTHNAHFAESGSMYSLYLAQPQVEEDFLLLESDIIYEQPALSHLQAQSHEDAVLLSGATKSGDEVYVEAPDGKLTRLSKNRSQLGPKIAGELVGISRISQRASQAMRRAAETVFQSTLQMEYEHALVAASAEQPIPCPCIEDLAWAEIDDEKHYARAQTQVYPLILARDALLKPAGGYSGKLA